MTKRRLVESMEMQVAATSYNFDILFVNMVQGWRGMPYAELSALLGFMTYLQQVHHTNHWVAAGTPSYSDHLLFQRLYEGVQGEIDSLGEKAVGLGSIANVDLPTIVQQVGKWSSVFGQTAVTVPSMGALARKSLDAELAFIKFVDATSNALDAAGLLTYGLDNQLAGFADSHETFVYLLKQRIAGGE